MASKKYNVLLKSISLLFTYVYRYQIINPGFLQRKYAAFIIETQPNGFNVERRYNDFVSFKKELAKIYSGYVLGQIPKKKTGKKFEKDFLNKRMKVLQSFLNDILKHPLLKTSELLFQFLSLSQKEWKTKIASKSALPGPKEVSECRTLEGIANVSITDRAESRFSVLNTVILNLKEHFKAYFIK